MTQSNEHKRHITQDIIEEVIHIPGCACRVRVGVTNEKFRDRLQQTVIGLMRIGLSSGRSDITIKELADDICVNVSIIESVLLILEQEGVVLLRDGSTRLNNDCEQFARLKDLHGWMFWNNVEETFLPVLLLDEDGWGLPSNTAYDSEANKNWQDSKITFSKLLEAARHQDFVVGRLAQNGTVMSTDDLQVRCISREITCLPWLLSVVAEIRPRFGGIPGIFLHDARALPDFPAETQFNPFLLKRIEQTLPLVKQDVDLRARNYQNTFLHDNHVEFLAKLGGEQKVISEANEQVEKALDEIKWSEWFMAPGLLNAARDAELNFILFQHNATLISEASVRRDYQTVLQALWCIVSDLSAEALKKPDIQKAKKILLESMHHQQPDEKRKYWQEELRRLEKVLGCDFTDWGEIATHLVDLKQFFSNVDQASQRHTLGAAFVCWCAVPLIGGKYPTAKQHLKWMQGAIDQMRNLPAIFNKVKNIRNDDKVIATGRANMTLEKYRSDVYAMWRAVGSRYNFINKEVHD